MQVVIRVTSPLGKLYKGDSKLSKNKEQKENTTISKYQIPKYINIKRGRKKKGKERRKDRQKTKALYCL